jgi:hypothetical protein
MPPSRYAGERIAVRVSWNGLHLAGLANFPRAFFAAREAACGPQLKRLKLLRISAFWGGPEGPEGSSIRRECRVGPGNCRVDPGSFAPSRSQIRT